MILQSGYVCARISDNFYLFRDGITMGDDLQFACKLQLHADNVKKGSVKEMMHLMAPLFPS